MKNEERNNIPVPGDSLLPLVLEIRDLVQSARRAASRNINTLQVNTNYEIGRRIVECEQKGKRRAEYGKQTLIELSHELTNELGRGFSERNLELMRRFYIEYHETVPQISPTVSGKSPVTYQIPQTVSAKLPAQSYDESPIRQTLSAQFVQRFTLELGRTTYSS